MYSNTNYHSLLELEPVAFIPTQMHNIRTAKACNVVNRQVVACHAQTLKITNSTVCSITGLVSELEKLLHRIAFQAVLAMWVMSMQADVACYVDEQGGYNQTSSTKQKLTFHLTMYCRFFPLPFCATMLSTTYSSVSS